MRTLHIPAAAALISLTIANSACSSSRPEQTGVTTNEMIVYAEKMRAEERVVKVVVAQWKGCAATLNARDGTNLAKRDVAKGEWRFATYRSYGLATFDMVPGLEQCDISEPEGHDRLPQLSSCGGEIAVTGEARSLDCSCQKVELEYRAAYNRVILRETENALKRNCT